MTTGNDCARLQQRVRELENRLALIAGLAGNNAGQLARLIADGETELAGGGVPAGRYEWVRSLVRLASEVEPQFAEIERLAR
ncbi:MAG: hypothetical protein FOGNACKC_02212 [Anaerolineae bacterium]|nr:hypothetical protein [Anaerolineae bacterium]